VLKADLYGVIISYFINRIRLQRTESTTQYDESFEIVLILKLTITENVIHFFPVMNVLSITRQSNFQHPSAKQVFHEFQDRGQQYITFSNCKHTLW